MAEQKEKNPLKQGGITKKVVDAPKELARRGAGSGADKMFEQMKEAAGKSDSPEEQAGDSFEYGAQDIAERGERLALDTGRSVKNKVEDKVKDKLSERLRERSEAEHVSDSRDTKVDIRTRDVESNTASRDAEPVRDRSIHARSDTKNADSIKTKENYIRRENEASGYVDRSESISPKEKQPTQAETKGAGNASAKESAFASDSATVKQPASRTYNGGKEFAQRQSRYRTETARYSRPATNAVQQTGKGTIKTAEKGAVKTARKGTVKTAQTTVKSSKTAVKTAERTAKTTAKAAKTTAKTAQKAARATAKAAKAAAQAAAKAAKLAAKAIATAVKAIIAAIKGLIAAIAAGGWVAVVIILAIALVAVILCACFGVFASNETTDGSKPMTDAIIEIDTGFKSGIDAKIAELSAGEYDEVVVEYVGDMDGDSSFLINWNDVIAVYSVRVTMADTNPTDVVEITPEKIEILEQTFADMNAVSYTTEVIETEEVIDNEDGDEETIVHRKLVIHVDVKSMDYLAAADLYAFDDTKREALEAMMEPRMLTLYAELIGVDVYGGADLTKIIGNLPVGTMGSEVVKLALSKVGSPYVLGAKGPAKFDCSGLVYWTIKELDPELGKKLYTSAGYQFKYCRDNNFLVGEAELQPGDLIFWQKPSCNCGKKYNEIHHTGIWLGDGMIVDASSSNGRVIVRKLFDGSSYKVYAYARPYSY